MLIAIIHKTWSFLAFCPLCHLGSCASLSIIPVRQPALRRLQSRPPTTDGPLSWQHFFSRAVYLTTSIVAANLAVAQSSSPAESAVDTPSAKQVESKRLPSNPQEKICIQAFTETHQGFSSDELLLRDDLRQKYTERCQVLAGQQHAAPDDQWCRFLLHVRKSGGRLPKTTRRAQRSAGKEHSHTSGPKNQPVLSESALLAAAEIAARRMNDELHHNADAILVDSVARRHFDKVALSVAPGASVYSLRKAALRLRKTRRLEPELLARVTDWKLSIEERAVDDVRSNPNIVPQRPGIYVFRDSTGYLYIGQASDLRRRLREHVDASDRDGLRNYLQDHTTEEIRLELHVFEKGSPGEQLAIRRAYESELIRTRSPRLNLAP